MSNEELKNRMDGILAGAGKKLKDVPEYAKNRTERKVTMDTINSWRKGKTQLSAELVIVYAELGDVLPSWILEDYSFENGIKKVIYRDIPERQKIYNYNVRKNVKGVLDEYRKENMVEKGKDWYGIKENGKLNMEDDFLIWMWEEIKRIEKVSIDYIVKISEMTGKGIDEIMLGKSEILDEVERKTKKLMEAYKKC